MSLSSNFDDFQWMHRKGSKKGAYRTRYNLGLSLLNSSAFLRHDWLIDDWLLLINGWCLVMFLFPSIMQRGSGRISWEQRRTLFPTTVILVAFSLHLFMAFQCLSSLVNSKFPNVQSLIFFLTRRRISSSSSLTLCVIGTIRTILSLLLNSALSKNVLNHQHNSKLPEILEGGFVTRRERRKNYRKRCWGKGSMLWAQSHMRW